MVDFDLTEEQNMLIQLAEQFADEELIPDSKILISGIDELKMMESNLAKPHKLPG